MSNKKQRKKEREDIWNPRILTLAEALELSSVGEAGDDVARKYAAGKAIAAINNRLSCRFTGPGNFNELTYGERMVWDLTYMQGEVLNGGFHQYLTNSTGDSGEDVKGYLTRIGAIQTLELFRRLSEIFPRGLIPNDRERRCALVEKWENRQTGNDLLDELDTSFYRQRESVDELILDYVKSRPHEFAEPSDEIVQRLKRKDKITEHYFGTSEPEWVDGAEKALEMLTDLAESVRAEADNESRKQIKTMIKAGKRTEAILEYRKRFLCNLAEAKAAVTRLTKE